MPATNSTHRFHSWSHTGGLGVPQPDNREETQQGGETESCMAVLNNFYGDGETIILSKIFEYLMKIFQASNGTMLLATTRSRSSARMWRATSPSPGRPSPTSGSPERGSSSQQHYLFIYLENYFCVITWKLFKRLGYYQTKIDHFDASLCCLSVSCRCEKD